MKKREFNSKEKNATTCRAKTLEVNFQPDPLCDFNNLTLGKCIVFTV